MDDEIIVYSPTINSLKKTVKQQQKIIAVLVRYLGVHLDSTNLMVGTRFAKDLERIMNKDETE